jgi:hypothetical protein
MQALVSQYSLLQELIRRNSLSDSAQDPDNSSKIPLPFIVLQADADADIDIRMSEDKRVGVLNFKRCAHSTTVNLLSAATLEARRESIYSTINCKAIIHFDAIPKHSQVVAPNKRCGKAKLHRTSTPQT